MQAQVEKDKKVKFSTQADVEVIKILRELASSEGGHIQSLVDEALREYIERKQNPRKHVVQSFPNSMTKYDRLYKNLAK